MQVGAWVQINGVNWSHLVCLVQARLIRILHVVSDNKFRGVIKLRGKEPQSYFVGTCVTSPADKIEELAVTPSPINFRVKDFLNFIFNFSIDLDRRWRRLNSIRNSVRMGEFKLGDVEDRMHRLHRVGESVCEGMGTRLLSGVISAPHLTSSQASTWVKTPQVGHIPLTI